MKPIISFILLLYLVSGFCTPATGQSIIIDQSNESGIYKKGENIRISVLLQDLPADSLRVRIFKNYSDKTADKKIKYSGQKEVLFDGAFNEATSLIIEVRANEEFASLGLVVDPGHFVPGTKRPGDFDRYWKKEKKALRALPMEVKSVPVNDLEEGFWCADTEINCTGPRPARGYFAKPVAAQPKSLPIVLYLHAAGVNGSWCLSKPENALRYARMGKGALCFDLNAHGMLNGQPQAYYDDLNTGALNNYSVYQGENREEVYFRGMYLRLIRTLDFLTSQPEWDGKRILVMGESQGGGQALAAAGLDPRVSAVVATVPAMCDWGATLKGWKGGWPNPYASPHSLEEMLRILPYFDVAHLLKKSKATLVTEIGFIDTTCPSASIYAALNQTGRKKIISGVPYRAHGLTQKRFNDIWDKTIRKPKMDFIEEYLK